MHESHKSIGNYLTICGCCHSSIVTRIIRNYRIFDMKNFWIIIIKTTRHVKCHRIMQMIIINCSLKHRNERKVKINIYSNYQLILHLLNWIGNENEIIVCLHWMRRDVGVLSFFFLNNLWCSFEVISYSQWVRTFIFIEFQR